MKLLFGILLSMSFQLPAFAEAPCEKSVKERIAAAWNALNPDALSPVAWVRGLTWESATALEDVYLADRFVADDGNWLVGYNARVWVTKEYCEIRHIELKSEP